jgi:hypothetical protein
MGVDFSPMCCQASHQQLAAHAVLLFHPCAGIPALGMLAMTAHIKATHVSIFVVTLLMESHRDIHISLHKYALRFYRTGTAAVGSGNLNHVTVTVRVAVLGPYRQVWHKTT